MTYPWTNRSGATLDVWEWISIPHVIHPTCYYLPMLGFTVIHVSKGSSVRVPLYKSRQMFLAVNPQLSEKHGPLDIYVKLRVAHVPGMPGTFSPPPLVSNPDLHHGTCVTHVPWCMPGSLTSGFLWSRGPGKRSQHSRRMRNRQFYVSGKRPMDVWNTISAQVLRKRVLVSPECLFFTDNNILL